MSLACPAPLHTLLSVNCHLHLTSLLTEKHFKYLMQLRTHSNLCVAVLNYLKNSSSLAAAAAAAVSPPRLKPPTSPPPGGAYRGPAQTGEPPQRIELGHGSQRVPLPVFSTGPGSLQRDVLSGTSKPQRWLGNLRCSVRAGPAECAPQQTHSCSGPR